MHHWRLLWDWNTLDSVRQIHSDLEGWALVFFALLVLFDVLAHLADEHPKREKLLERIGLWCFGVAVLAEIVAYPYGQRNDTLSERAIVSLSDLTGTADKKARQALGDASTAITRSGKAVTDSAQAKTSASDALTLARGARQEADTFENRLGTAEHKADEAEQHLAESLKLANEAGAEADRLKQRFSDRAIDVATATNALKMFAGQTFRITVYGNREPLALANQIYDALVNAGWIVEDQEEPRGLFPGIVGIEVYLHPSGDSRAKGAANVLVSTLNRLGQHTTLKMQNDPNDTTPKKNRVEINIGTKE